MVDLNLIKVFVTIYDTQSVSLAALKLNITQPSVSHGLSRLRYIFKDQLFNRTKQGMLPTLYAVKLYEELHNPLSEIENVINDIKAFDQQKSDKCFKVGITDLSGLSTIPTILSKLKHLAPNIGIEIVSTDHLKMSDWLITARVDVAISNKLIVDKSLNSCKIFQEYYVGLCHIKLLDQYQQLSLDDYIHYNHIELSTPNENHIDIALNRLGLKRKIKLRLAHLGLFKQLLTEQDLILTLPAKLAHHFNDDPRLSTFELPFDLPIFDVSLHWHKKSEDMLPQKWFIPFLQQTLYSSHQSEASND
ncbi:LysR family transcriptional regulator [Acinetobacter calcoaceticus]|uniref:LysR family transcriptional regulator n=1 Tax=Acinetobacter calcoaceticus TaxID=471 RepID=A0A4R1XHQ7_ACICA|nr:LysR family transcriptional regulator [Acinetobacter calcoaceticus]